LKDSIALPGTFATFQELQQGALRLKWSGDSCGEPGCWEGGLPKSTHVGTLLTGLYVVKGPRRSISGGGRWTFCPCTPTLSV